MCWTVFLILISDGVTVKSSDMQTRWARTHAKSCKVVTTFALFIRLSSNLAGWWNSVFQKILCFMFFDFNGFWRENDVTRLTAKLKFQGMAKQINNFERTWRDRNKCEKIFSKTQSVGVIKLWFLNFPPFCYYF